LANDLNLSPSYLSVTFKNSSGENISVFITRIRLEMALHHLKDPTLSMHDIAKQIGYVDSHYFSRVFKKKYGFTPSEYRNMSFPNNSL